MWKGGNGQLWFSPTDLVRFAESAYLAHMERQYLEDPGDPTPDEDDPILESLSTMGGGIPLGP